MTRPTALMFDMDGTLLELPVDIEAARQALADFFRPWGVTRPFRPILSRIREAAVEAAMSGGSASSRGDDAPQLARAGFDILDRFELAAAYQVKPYAGVPALIDALARADVSLALVTNNGRACVLPALEAAGLRPAAFTAIVSRDDVLEPKPDPEGILRVAQALPANADIWYIGDQVSDIRAGQAAAIRLPGLRTAALCAHGRNHQALAEAGPDRLISDLAEILNDIEVDVQFPTPPHR